MIRLETTGNLQEMTAPAEQTKCFDIGHRLPDINLTPIILSHGWINLPPAERIADGFRYSLLLNGQSPVTISIKQIKSGLMCCADRRLDADSKTLLHRHLARMLSVSFPLIEFERLCTRRRASSLLHLAREGWGRMFRAPTAWEDAVKTLCTTNASWGYTVKMCERLCRLLGETTPCGRKTFPTPGAILARGGRFLTRVIRMGYRAKYLLMLARTADSGKATWLLDPTADPPEETALSIIREWMGFGDYATAHMMMLLGFHNYLPVDREVASQLGIVVEKSGRIPQHDLFARWGKFRFTAYKLQRVRKGNNWIG